MRQQILRLGKNSMIYGVGTMLTRFINLLLLPLYTAYLTPSDYGVLAFLALLGFIAEPIFSLGLGAGMGPCYFENNDEKHKATSVWTAFLLLFASASILIAIGLVFPRQLSQMTFRTTDYSRLVSFSLSGIAVHVLSTPFVYRLQFEERVIPFVVLTLISTLASIGLSLLTVVFLSWGILGIVFSQIAGHSIHLILFMLFAGRDTEFHISWIIGKELLRLSLPLVPSFAFLFLLLQSNRYILQWFRGLDTVGIYSVGFNLGAAMRIAVGAFQTAWYPYFMSYMDRQEEAQSLFGRIFTYYVYAFGSLCLIFFIVAKPVVLTMTQPSFHDAYLVVGFSATAQFLIGLFSLSLPSIYFAKEVKYMSLVQGVAAAMAVLLNMVLIPTLGMFGAGIGLVAGFLAMVVLLQAWNVKRKCDYLWIDYEWIRILKFSSLFIIFAGVALYRRYWPLWMEVILSIGLMVVLVGATLVLLTNRERLLVQHLMCTALSRCLNRSNKSDASAIDAVDAGSPREHSAEYDMTVNHCLAGSIMKTTDK